MHPPAGWAIAILRRSLRAERRCRKRCPARQRRAGNDRSRRGRRLSGEDGTRSDRRRGGIKRGRQRDHWLGRSDLQAARSGVVANRVAQRAQHRPRRNVCSVELIGKDGHDAHANAPARAFDHKHVPIEPDAIGELREQWNNRSEDAAAGEICMYVGGEWAAVYEHGDRGSRWE
jgi:hypothetical protein